MNITCDGISLISDITSLIISVLAVWLSLYFFKAAKDAEKETAIIQNEIKNQVDALTKVNNDLLSAALKYLGDNLTKLVEQADEFNSKVKSETATMTHATELPPEKNVRASILRSISILNAKTGRAVSMELFDLLKHDYDFGVILSELLRMNGENIITWSEAPKPPEALASIETVKPP